MSRPKLPRPTPRMKVVLDLIQMHGPISPNDLTGKDGLCRADVDLYVRELKKDGLIHIHSFEKSPCRSGYTVKRYVAGAGEDARRPKPKRVYKRKGGGHGDSVSLGRKLKGVRRAQEIVHIPARDPLTCAMFGEGA